MRPSHYGRLQKSGRQRVGRRRSHFHHLRMTLLKMGAVPHSRTSAALPPELDSEICRPIRTTRLKNHEIRKRLGLQCTRTVRSRRKAYHYDPRHRGQPVPTCNCGDEFQHVHRCRFMKNCAKPLHAVDAADMLAHLIAGVLIADIRERYGLSNGAANNLLGNLRPSQRKSAASTFLIAEVSPSDVLLPKPLQRDCFRGFTLHFPTISPPTCVKRRSRDVSPNPRRRFVGGGCASAHSQLHIQGAPLAGRPMAMRVDRR